MVSAGESGSGARPSSLLEILGSEEWEALRRHMTTREYEPGDSILARGSLEPDFQIIVEGVALVSALKPQGERLELSRLGRGDCIGEMALLTGEPASADIHAMTRVTTHAITQTELSTLDKERSHLIEALSVILAGRLQRANERLLTMHMASVTAIDTSAAGSSLLARLPKEMARVTGARVLVVASGAACSGAAFLDSIAGEQVAIEVIRDGGSSDIREVLHRFMHQYGQIVLFATSDALATVAQDAQYYLRVQPANGAKPTEMTGAEQLVIASEQPWTHANVRRLSAQFGQRVVGVLPPSDSGASGSGALAKLARVVTKRQVGVALGAGAAKGYAHIGVLRAFIELGIPIDALSGSSIGAAIAAGYAAGLTPDELSETATRISAKAMNLTVPIYSFFNNNGIREELQSIGAETRFEDLRLPLAVVATDLYRRSEVTFTSGIVWPCVLASMAIPGIYPPLRARGSYLVDGGVLCPVPAKQTRDLGAGIAIGVRLTGKSTSPRTTLDVVPSRPLTTETIMRSMEIMNNRISEVSNDQADVTIEVSLEGGGLSDFKRGKQYMEEGYRATMAAAESLISALPFVRGVA